MYHIGGSDDLMAMAAQEDVMISMPHPRTKGSTGFPDAVKDTAAFRDAHYQGVGFRWGMGLDLSEQRLCERRCLALLDDMSNWTADRPGPPKYILSISEVRYQSPGDDIYASAPVSYVKLDRLPSPDDVSPVVAALRRGDYFVTSGEVLIPSYEVKGTRSSTDHRGRRRMDLPARLRRGRMGRRRHHRSEHCLDDRTSAERRTSFQHPVRLDGAEVGALRGMGFRRQRGVGPADQAGTLIA